MSASEKSEKSGSFVWLSSALIVALVAALGFILWKKVGKTQTFQILKLCELSDTNQVAFVSPNGQNLSFIVGIPALAQLEPASIQGSLKVYLDQTLVQDIDFVLTNCATAGWLNNLGMNSWVISWPKNSEAIRLDSYFQSGKQYRLRVEINDAQNASIWLAYTQAWEERQHRGYVVK